MIMKRTIFILSIIFFFVGCGDEWVPITLVVNNTTKDTISITLLSKTYEFVSLPNSSKEFYKTEAHPANNFDCDPRIYDEVETKTNSGKTLKKNFADKNNWNCEGDKHNGWTMTFVITENDLEYEKLH